MSRMAARARPRVVMLNRPINNDLPPWTEPANKRHLKGFEAVAAAGLEPSRRLSTVRRLKRLAPRVIVGPTAKTALGERTDPIMRQNEGDMAKELAEGDSAPGFELPTDGGGRTRLADLRGKPAVIYFYPRDDTSGCTAEAIAFNALRAKFAAAGASIIGVSPDSPASHDKFKHKHELKIALAADPERSAIEAYGVWKEKSMYGRKYFGVERSTFLIDRNGRIARIWRKVKVPGHAEEVLAAAKAL
jgi:peroxiredoxin Q/BCP